jgi:hypothetical protein
VELLAYIGEITGVECYESTNLHARIRQNVPDYAVYGAEVSPEVRRSLKLFEAILDHVCAIRLVWQHLQTIQPTQSLPVLL